MPLMLLTLTVSPPVHGQEKNRDAILKRFADEFGRIRELAAADPDVYRREGDRRDDPLVPGSVLDDARDSGKIGLSESSRQNRQEQQTGCEDPKA